MNAHERFERTRRSVARLNEVKLLIMYGCDDWRPAHIRAKTDKPDPTANEAMHRVDVLGEQLDELKREQDELESFIGVTLTIIAQVRAGFGEIYADVLEARYIDNEKWPDIADKYESNHENREKVTVRTVQNWAAVACDWVDSVGVSRLLNGDIEL